MKIATLNVQEKENDPAGRFQKNIQRYQRKAINVQGYGKSEMRVFQKGGRSQHSTYCKVILSESSAGEMTGVEATPEWFEESADGKNRMETVYATLWKISP